jgi:hypothetical protein
MPRGATGISRVLTKREDVTLVHGYRLSSSRIVLLRDKRVYAVDSVLRRVIHPTIGRLIRPSEIHRVDISRDGGFNLYPMRCTGTSVLIGAMQGDGVVYYFD